MLGKERREGVGSELGGTDWEMEVECLLEPKESKERKERMGMLLEEGPEVEGAVEVLGILERLCVADENRLNFFAF
jgi:hypothetical protein